MKGLKGMMSQLEELQKQMAENQEKIQAHEVTGESGAGLVKVKMNGRHDVTRVELDDSVLSEEKSFLEDLLAAAVNDAVRKIEQYQKENMSDITKDIPKPPGFKFPF